MARLGGAARPGAAAVGGALCMLLASSAASFGARRERTIPTALAAAKLARVIWRDARVEHRHFRHAVSLDRDCCGGHVLRVRHRAHHVSGTDEYIFSVATRAGAISGVVLTERTRDEMREPDGGLLTTTSEYDFGISRETVAGRARWFFSATTATTSQTTGGSGAHIGLGSSSECASPKPLTRPLFTLLLSSMAHARRHHRGALAPLAATGCG